MIHRRAIYAQHFARPTEFVRPMGFARPTGFVGPKGSATTARFAKSSRSNIRRVGWWLALVLPFGIVAGCQEPPPTLETHRVTGMVQFRNGDPVQSGTIDFRSQRDQRLSMNAEITEDGSFELTTLHENQNLPGAVAGPCSATVTIFLPGNPIPLVVDVPETFDVTSGDNEFLIKLKLPPPQARSN